MEKVKGDFNMAKENDFNLEELQVVKRNGKKVDFNETKIALAIKKAFDDVLDNSEEEEAPKYSEKDIKFIYFVKFQEHILQCEIVVRDNEAFTFIHKKTTPLKAEDKDIIFTTEADQRANYLGRLTKPLTQAGKKILYFFANNKVFYQSNEVGEIMQHYLNWSNNLLK